MFKKFSLSTDVSGQTPVKSSVQRSIRGAVLSQWKIEPGTLEVFWPKKETLTHVKCKEHLSIYAVQGEPIFFQQSDGPIYPTLRVLHKYPFILPAVKVDRGAIRFLLSGANMMCPGLTSAGGYLPPDDTPLEAGAPVAIFTEGKDHAAAIGITKMSTIEMRKVNKGIGVETITYLGDDLWAIETLSRKNRKGRGTVRTTTTETRLQNLRAELGQDGWFAQCRQMIDDSLSDLKLSFSATICLGLGSPSSSQDACVQLAFLLEICDYLLIERQRISLYDPVFTEEDLTLLQGLQVAVLPTNENGLYPVDVPTIVFMPHCNMDLYENFLKANWKPDPGAVKLLMIANQLSEYVVNNPLNKLVTTAPYLVQVGM